MKEQFCTYEISLKLKELGFDEPCLARYPIVTVNYSIINDLNLNNCLLIGSGSINDIKAPLWQQLVDWFREKHNLHIVIEGDNWDSRFKFDGYIAMILHTIWETVEEDIILYQSKEIKPYNIAREEAILKAIELCQK